MLVYISWKKPRLVTIYVKLTKCADSFSVTVEDVNEEGPVFEQSSYHKILLDNSTAGMLVVDINARDEGKGYDEGIFYNISGMLGKKSYGWDIWYS